VRSAAPAAHTGLPAALPLPCRTPAPQGVSEPTPCCATRAAGCCAGCTAGLTKHKYTARPQQVCTPTSAGRSVRRALHPLCATHTPRLPPRLSRRARPAARGRRDAAMHPAAQRPAARLLNGRATEPAHAARLHGPPPALAGAAGESHGLARRECGPSQRGRTGLTAQTALGPPRSSCGSPADWPAGALPCVPRLSASARPGSRAATRDEGRA